MQSLNREQLKLVELLRTLYNEILPLEQELGLLVSNTDQRPRIDYFFDALRALTDSAMPAERRLERLSLEWLSYDATAIRYLENKPLGELNPHQAYQSPETRVRKQKTEALSTKRTANREDKRVLSQLYLRFGVMFVALFKPFADRDYRDQMEEMETQAQEVSDVKTAIEALGQGNIKVAQLKDAAEHCSDSDLKKLVDALIEKQRYKQSDYMKAAMIAAKSRLEQKNNELVSIQATHMHFAASQLALYENGKDVVKQLASEGLNVAGEHLNQTLSQANQRGRER